ncbi:P1 family peptidase [Paracoccus sp. CPCC 101403]|uniref:P1 family peptidase n=1 Tax=Paracoccus broussonetiae TaxID=3075834 RepID=A0ABU3EEE7_9RHOB|nr:P1 family peptidase [Paracoccus sp. CPCC 101403]MDT1062496.1 P1 family peptidase [Paracoccus sp. CPCC 101403]
MARAREFGLEAGIMSPGAGNAITDVPGVRVGHTTLRRGTVNTGVTAIVPQPGNLFLDKLTAAVEVINGFGKSAGLVQVAELGTLETPILLTNTFGVGTCVNALIRRAIAETPAIGRETSTVNAVACECNDGPLSDIQALAVTEADALAALDAAGVDVAEGSVGAGTGMSCFGFKGGIGTASRRIAIAGRDCHLGALVLANFGRAGDLVLPDGRRPDPRIAPQPEKGSIIVILATDAPVDQRQLQRICRRAGAGIARLGAFWGHGSGDIVLGFTTANRVPHFPQGDTTPLVRLSDSRIDDLFRAACESTEEAILNALCTATEVTGPGGLTRPQLSDWLRGH